MKYIVILSVLLFCFACRDEEDETDGTVGSGNEVVMTIAAGGEFIHIDENPLTKAGGQAESAGVLGVLIYSAPLNAADESAYTPYAYGLFDDWTQLSFTASKESKYKMVATMIVSAKGKLHAEGGVLKEPFGMAVNNAFVYSETADKLQGIGNSLCRLKDGQTYTVADVDRYYGEKTDIRPMVSTSVSLFLKRVVFGVQYVVSGLTQGELVCELQSAPTDTVKIGEAASVKIYSFSNIPAAWGTLEEESRYTEKMRLKVSWVMNGTSKVLADQYVDFKRRMQTNVRMTIAEASGTVDIVLEDQAMGNGGNVDGGTGEGDGLSFNGSITLETQQQVDEFGAKGYLKAAILYIDNKQNRITDLSPLTSLKSIDLLDIKNMVSDSLTGLHNVEVLNTLYLTNCTLKSLAAFRNVKSLSALQVKNINTLNGLRSLEYVNGFWITESPRLTSLKGLEHLIKIRGQFYVSGCVNLENIDELKSLREVESLTISDCKKLSSVRFEALESVFGIVLTLECAKEIDLPNLVSAQSLLVSGNSSVRMNSLNLQNLASVSGDLTLSKINLSVPCSLSRLKTAGSLSVSNSDLGMISLKSLETVSGNLQISYCSNIRTLGLDALTTIGGDFSLTGCDDMRYIQGMPLIQTIGGSIKLSSCELLQGCDDLSRIGEIGGDLILSYCSKLPNVYGFDNLERIGGGLSISSCSYLMNLDGFKKLKSVGKDVNINGGYSGILSDLKGLGNLENIGGSLILDCDKVTALPAFGNLTIGRDLKIDADVLPSLSGLEALTTIAGDLALTCPKLTSLSGLGNVRSFGGGISVKTSSLPILSELHWPTEVFGTLALSCDAVSDLTPLKDITSVYGDLKLERLECTTFGLPVMTDIGGSLFIKSCSSLTGITNLSQLKSIGVDLYISYCLRLTSLPVFSADLSVRQYVDIDDCDLLTNISNLGRIHSVGRMFRFTGNAKLSDFCAIKPLIGMACEVYTMGNLYDPTKSDILNGKCSK